MALKIMEQLPLKNVDSERAEAFQSGGGRLTRRRMVEVYKFMSVVAKVDVYLHSPNGTLLETETLREVCRRLKMDAMLPYPAFGELPWHFLMESDEGRQQQKAQKGLDKFLENRSIN